MIEDFISSGNITWAILAILAVEALSYMFYFKRLRNMWPTLAAGGCFVLALRAALLHQSMFEVAVFLALSFVFHVLEVRQWLKISKHLPL
jgi:hypothetical protein